VKALLDLEIQENTKMSNPAKGRMKAIMIVGTIIGATFVAASIAGLRVEAQAGHGAPVQVPAAPAGGIDPSKMPDVVGIHLGMPPQDVIAKMKVLFPENHPLGLGLTPGYAKFGHAPAPPWIQTLVGKADACGNNECADIVSVVFNGPPNKQGVTGIERGINFQEGKRPTPDTMMAALLKKYGPNPFVPTQGTIGWAYDEQGQQIAPPNGKALVQCAGTVTSGAVAGPTPTNAAPEYGLTGTNPLTQADVADLMRNPCRVGVYVLVSMNVSAQVVNGIDIKISDNSEATRDVIAEQQYLDSVAAGQQQQQLNKAQQQAPPKF
jgi:hypothetical protein